MPINNCPRLQSAGSKCIERSMILELILILGLVTDFRGRCGFLADDRFNGHHLSGHSAARGNGLFPQTRTLDGWQPTFLLGWI